MASTSIAVAPGPATQPSFHHGDQFAVRLSPAQHPRPQIEAEAEAPTWSAADGSELPEMPRKKQAPVPRHPIPSMQAAFAESFAEVTAGTLELKPKLRTQDANARRNSLLDQDKTDGAPAALWRFRPNQECHELRKLMAQISFGVYLLLNGMANSNAQVVSILQGHIDEVDEFLEMTMEDVSLATQDLSKRLDLLKLPMDNMAVFEKMLEDRNFRLQIVEGNLKIEHIVSRTTTALAQSALDVSEGLKSTKEFSEYLSRLQTATWRESRPDVVEIFDAMKGNTDGWLNAFVDLQAKTTMLDVLIVKLNNMVEEMDKRAGEVSRNTRFSVRPFTSPVATPASPSHSRHSSAASSELSPPASPGLKVAASPPRISLRFSSILGDSPAGAPSFFDLPSRNSVLVGHSVARDSLPEFQYTPAPTPDAGSGPKSADELFIPEAKNDDEPLLPEPDVSEETKYAGDSPATPGDSPAITEPEQKSVPEPLTIKTDLSEEDFPMESPVGDNPLYILQPRTYTPLPPAPLPSPRVISPPAIESEFPLPAQQHEESALRSSLPSIHEKSELRNLSPPTQHEPRVPRRSPSRIKDEAHPKRQASLRVPDEADDVVSETGLSDTGSLPRQRSSLRQRVSLRTTPPHSIQVPPPNAPQLQRPVFASPKTYQNYQTFTGPPDSAYGSDRDLEAAAAHRDRSAAPSTATADFGPPTAGPGAHVVPSPHSDQQYFRPVQASPHSPLQQRPATAGPAGGARPQHHRNAPSAMGMSMLSSVTTANPETGTVRTLKKKRSAFGWLKKAFTLDDEERAEFDARKREQNANLYYDVRSPPQFRDGRRIR